jgi:hypothetical protein
MCHRGRRREQKQMPLHDMEVLPYPPPRETSPVNWLLAAAALAHTAQPLFALFPKEQLAA